MSRALTIEQVKERLLATHNGLVELVESTYIDTLHKATFIDQEYGEFDSYVNKVLRGRKHPKRAKADQAQKMRDKPQDREAQRQAFLDKIEANSISQVKLVGEYRGARRKTEFLDVDYGIFTSTPMHILRHQFHPQRSKDQKRAANIAKFGGPSPMSCPKVKAKTKATYKAKYGVDNYTQTEEYRQRMIAKGKIRLLPWGQTIGDLIQELDLPFANSTIRRVIRENRHLDKDGIIKACKEIGSSMVSEERVRTKLQELTGKSFPKKRIKMFELDGYCEELKLAFEYDGYQHFERTWYDKDDKALAKRQERDRRKDKLCEDMGIQLIRVPHWVPDIEAYVEEEYGKQKASPAA